MQIRIETILKVAIVSICLNVILVLVSLVNIRDKAICQISTQIASNKITEMRDRMRASLGPRTIDYYLGYVKENYEKPDNIKRRPKEF